MTPLEEGKLIATVEHLTTAVEQLTVAMTAVQARYNYWRGALAMLVLMSSGVGAGAALAVQWFHR